MIATAVAHPPPDTAPALVRTVTMTDTAVSPSAVVVAPGTPVAWVNVGRNRHTVTEDAGRFGSRVMPPGATFRLSAPAAPGSYAYHCRFHGYIRGTLTVSLVSLEAPAPVVVGGRPALAGTVPGAAPGTLVRVERRLPGAWEEAGIAPTDATGGFQVEGPPLTGRTAFRAVAGADVSPSVRAEARPALTVRRRGAPVLVSARPVTHGARARLERLDLATYRWRPFAERPLTGRTRFRLRAPGVYRAVAEAHGGLSAAVSRVVPFRAGAFRD